MEKTAIVQHLQEKYNTLLQLLEGLSETRVAQPIAPDKWSIGQHGMHLVLSTRPLNKALRMPKADMTAMFGTKGERAEHSEAELVDLYRSLLDGGLQAPSRFSPADFTADEKAGLLAELRKELAELLSALELWDESALSAHVMPHPAMGLLTVREMMMFTIHHTEHHRSAMQKSLE